VIEKYLAVVILALIHKIWKLKRLRVLNMEVEAIVEEIVEVIVYMKM
jgi:hypothetical protein